MNTTTRITVIIDPSTAKESDCAYKFRLMNLEGWRKELQKSSLTFGSAVHRAIAHRLKNRVEKKVEKLLAKEDGTKAYESVIETIDSPTILDIIRDASEWYINSRTEYGKSDFRTPAFLVETLKQYFDTYAFDPFQTNTDLVELPFAYKFELFEDLDVEFMLCGVVDRIGKQGPVPFMFQDTKTSSSNSPDQYLREYETSFQMMTYTWVLRQVFELTYYPPYQIDGIFMKGNWRTQERGVVFKRSDIIDPRPDLVEEHIEWLRQRCRKIAEDIRSGKHLRNFSRCITTFGACEYYRVCTAQEAFRSGILESEFVQKRYDPATFGD